VETSEEKRALTPQRREVARWHAEPVDRVLATLESSADGLDSGRAQTRLAEVGPNVLPRPTREGVLTLLWRQINSPLIYVLLGSGILAIALGRLTDGAVVHKHQKQKVLHSVSPTIGDIHFDWSFCE